MSDDLRHEECRPADGLWKLFSERLSEKSVLRRNEPLAKRTTLRVGGPAEWYCEPACEIDLAWIVQACSQREIAWMVLGRGSNLLIRDGGIRGMVICLAQAVFSRIQIEGTHLRCGAGSKLRQVAAEARRHGLSGLEFMEGIPGSVGGALRMNAGAMGGSMFQHVASVRYLNGDGSICEREGDQIEVHYRNCPMLKGRIALGAVLSASLDSSAAVAERMKECSKKRWASQPAAASAGCIFKNPPAIPAGKLVEELGLKGTRIGGAEVSEVHGNFIVNSGGATADDVLNLIELIRDRALAERGIELETEVEIVGGPPFTSDPIEHPASGAAETNRQAA